MQRRLSGQAWQAARAIWSTPRGPEEPAAAANPLTAPPGSTAAGASAADAAAINPLLQVPQAPKQAPKPGKPAKGKADEKEQVGLAVLRNIHMSPKKLALWAKMVRRLHVEDAMIQCTISVNKGAKILAGVIHSARANAVNNFGLNPSKLVIDRAEVGHGSHRKKVWFHGKGRTGIRKKYFSHLWIAVKEGTKQRVTRFVKPLLERPRKSMPPAEAQRFSKAQIASRRHTR
ncbi:hypothetical protein WJX81_003626 [Elliptochloris bilobata]|uniref:50S ribosomal protein L22, chloroplastic n=1 Tax=Elliptochloris bilobata TaxID=381761 RepID=A0AAW1RKJ0_9CHLO